VQRVVDLAFALHLRRPTAIERWLTSPRVAHDGMWIYIDPSTAYLDARMGEQFDGIIFIRDITPIHPTENALRTTAALVGGF
jgi:erythromycin esterase-like protein